MADGQNVLIAGLIKKRKEHMASIQEIDNQLIRNDCMFDGEKGTALQINCPVVI